MFKSQVLKIYFWRLFSLLSGFLSLLVVIPHLSSNKELYGIYMFCLSFNLYLSYADLGFLSAGQKYASEEFAKGNKVAEAKCLGFTAFVLLCFILPFSFSMFILYYNPDWVMSGLSSDNLNIAASLFLIIGIFSPIQVILQRLAQSILIIRLKDYVALRVDIVFNIIKALAIFFFFTEDNYLIVEYFLFINLLTIVSAIVVLSYIKIDEKYDLIYLIKAIRFDMEYFLRIRQLAISNFVLSFSYILYFELDLIYVSKFFSPTEVAIYSIGFSLLNFTRNLWNIIYSPFGHKFNHYVGLQNFTDLKSLLYKLMSFTFPISVLSVVVLITSAKFIVISWVGAEYFDSIVIFKILIIGSLFNFIQQPSSYYFIATINYRYIYLNALITPLIYLVTLTLLMRFFGYAGIAFAKIMAILSSTLISYLGLSNLINLKTIFKEWFLSLMLISVGLYLGLKFCFSIHLTNPVKDLSILAITAVIILGSFSIAIFFVFLLNKTTRPYLFALIRRISLRFN